MQIRDGQGTYAHVASRPGAEGEHAGQTFSAFVRGTPAPKGSKSAFVKNGRAFVTEGKSSKQWQSDVSRYLRDSWEDTPAEGPVRVRLTFSFLRPPSVSEKKRPRMTVKPDIDKLARAVLDAMTGICFRDDAQVVHLELKKNYDNVPAVFIVMETLS